MALKYFSQVQEGLHREGTTRMRVEILHGDAAQAIIDLARQTPHNLVAMTTHGRSGVGRWALGSVTERVIEVCRNVYPKEWSR